MTTTTETDIRILTQRQLSLEEDTTEEAARTYQDKLIQARMKGKDMTVFSPERYLLAHSVEKTATAIHEWLLPTRGKRIGEAAAARKTLATVSPYELAYITARHMVNSMYLDVPFQRIALGLAREVRTHINYIRLKKAEPLLVKSIEEAVRTSNLQHKSKVWTNNLNSRGIEGKYAYVDWDDAELFAIGNVFARLWMQTTGLAETRLERKGTKTVTKLMPRPEVMDHLGKCHDQAKFLNPTYPPMLVKPLPWTSFYGGGYLTNFGTRRLPMVSCKSKEVRKMMEETPMPKVQEALNIIQGTAWKINVRVLDVLKQVRDLGGNMAGIPAMSQELVKPVKPWATKEEGERIKKTDPEAFKDYTHKAKVFWDNWARSNSKRIAIHKKVRFGEQFRNEREFYMPAYCDWRGRVYFSPYVNPQSDDSGRALLMFANPKPITEDGIKWLYIHGANCYGEDKVPFDERIKFIEENMDTILECAADPMRQQWWMDADDPFKFLAFCFEVEGVKRDGANHLCGIPIALDGACNAYQHYMGLLKDEGEASRHVNLIPGVRPGDIYGEVAKLVAPVVEAKALAGDELAQLWVGKINRDICKTATMTSVYGVSSWGIVEQLIEKITKKDQKVRAVEDRFLGPDYKKTPRACAYLGPLIEEAIKQVVTSASRAMEWLQEVAGIVSEVGNHLEWTTPIGFRAVQMYRKANFRTVKSVLGGVTFTSTLAEDIPGTISKRHMRNAAAPCFVHSMDSSMLMETVRNCFHKHNMTDFALVHDSYGTHACDTTTLARELRGVFVGMYHDKNPLAVFKDEVEAHNPGIQLPALPRFGTLDVRQVLDSPYFFA